MRRLLLVKKGNGQVFSASGFELQVSGVRLQVSGFGFQVSGFDYQVSVLDSRFGFRVGRRLSLVNIGNSKFEVAWPCRAWSTTVLKACSGYRVQGAG